MNNQSPSCQRVTDGLFLMNVRGYKKHGDISKHKRRRAKMVLLFSTDWSQSVKHTHRIQ